MAATLDDVLDEIAAIQRRARARRATRARPRWPMIVLRTPKGWTGPEGGRRAPGRRHRSARTRCRSPRCAPTPSTSRSSRSGCAPTGPRSCSTRPARSAPEITALAPEGELRMSANPHANGGLLMRDLELPDFRDYGVEVPAPATTTSEATRVLGGWLRDVMRAQPRPLPDHGTRRDRVEPAVGACSRPPTACGRPSCSTTDDHLAPRRAGDGGAVRAPVPGLARGLPADRPPRPVQLLRGVHPHHRLDVQPARQVAEGHPAHPVAPADRRRSTICSRTSGARTTTASPTRTPASSTTSSTRRRRSSASTCRPTPTACCRSPTTACAAATTST